MFHFSKFYITCASLEPFFLFLINLLILLFNFNKKDYSYIKKNFYYIIIIQNSYIYIILIILIYNIIFSYKIIIFHSIYRIL